MPDVPEWASDHPVEASEVEAPVHGLSARCGMAERLLEIGRDCASHLSESELNLDVDEMLYDERGLPK